MNQVMEMVLQPPSGYGGSVAECGRMGPRAVAATAPMMAAAATKREREPDQGVAAEEDHRRMQQQQDEQLLLRRRRTMWSKIASQLPGRTDNEIKNYWRTRVQKHANQLNCDVNSRRFKDSTGGQLPRRRLPQPLPRRRRRQLLLHNNHQQLPRLLRSQAAAPRCGRRRRRLGRGGRPRVLVHRVRAAATHRRPPPRLLMRRRRLPRPGPHQRVGAGLLRDGHHYLV